MPSHGAAYKADGNDDLIVQLAFPLTAHGRKGGDPSTDTYVAWGISDKPEPHHARDMTPPLDRNGGASGRAMPIAFSRQDDGGDAMEDAVPTLRVGTGKVSENNSWAGNGAVAVAENQRGELFLSPATNRQAVGGGKPGQGYAAALQGTAVRRLTPMECERLQAFPDGWTCLCGVEPYSTWDCRCPDGPRYAALGNAVTVNVVAWIGGRLLRAHYDAPTTGT